MQVNLRQWVGYNKLGDEGWCAIFDALRDSPQNKIAKWDLINQGINPTIAKSLAGYAAASSSLTSLRLDQNQLGSEGAKALAPAIAASSTLARLSLYGNDLGDEGKAAIREAVSGKEGFHLLM